MKILIIKPSSFGDIIQANPILQAVKAEWNDARIDWLVFKQWEQIVKLFPNVASIKCWDRKGGLKAFFEILRECNKESYDIAIDLQGLFRTALFTKLLKAKFKIGVSGMKELSWLLIKEPYKRDPKLNAVLRNLKSLTYITGKEYSVNFKIVPKENMLTDVNDLLSLCGIKETDEIIAFMPFSRGKTKSWDGHNYIKLAEMINKKNKEIKIIVLGASDDFGKIIAGNITDLCGKTDLSELALLLKRCKFAVGADTGPMHLANASGVKCAFIFGGSDINETSPYGNNAKIISANMPCSPCRGRCKYDTEKCLESIKPENLFERVEEWIK
ncbi:MAG: glycosyltransferase family 9 protein [Endomicrobiaceae bacterium]